MDEDLQAERWLEHAVEMAHACDGLSDDTGKARLRGDDEGEAVLGVAGALQDGVDVGSDARECAGDGGDDAGFVIHDEAQVMRGDELSGDGARGGREGYAAGVLRDGEEI